MILYRSSHQRRAATVVECAIVLPITFFLILGMIIGALGIFRYQQVASIAREGARWAAVHGRDYSEENNQPVTTAKNVYDNAIQPMAVILDPASLTYSVAWDDAGERPTYLNSANQPKKNNVRVTVTYQWVPEAYLGGITLSSTSMMPISY
jgi:Flp pilus assembly protein TadG